MWELVLQNGRPQTSAPSVFVIPFLPAQVVKEYLFIYVMLLNFITVPNDVFCQSVVKLMRGVLYCMMKQMEKVMIFLFAFNIVRLINFFRIILDIFRQFIIIIIMEFLVRLLH